MKKYYKKRENTTKRITFNAHKGVLKKFVKSARKSSFSQNRFLNEVLKDYFVFQRENNLFFEVLQ